MKEHPLYISKEDISKRIESVRIPPSSVRDLITVNPISEEEIRRHEKNIAECNSFEELNDYIQKNPVLLKNSYLGLDHVEHTLKRIELACILTSSLLAPEHLGVQKKVHDLLEKEGNQDLERPDNEVYKTFLRNRFPDMHISEKEALRLSQKVPADLFGSLDFFTERITILLNSIEGAQTGYSCGGHNDQPELPQIGAPNFGSAYITFDTDNPDFFSVLENTLPSQIGEQTFITLARRGHYNRINIHFTQYPPDEWIVRNNKQSITKIFEDSRQEIERQLGRRIPSESPAQSVGEILPDTIQAFSAAAAKETRDEVFKNMQGKPVKEIREEERRRDTELQMILPGTIMSQEYREYFVSDEAQEKVKDFFSRIERIAQSFRERA